MIVKNLAWVKSLTHPDIPELGTKLAEALQSIADQATQTESQANVNPAGQPQSPPAINGVKVTGQNGHFQIAVTDNNQIYRDVHYWAEHADNPNFTNPVVIHMGQSRNYNEFLGNVTRYWRAYSSYSSSPPSAPAYHGSAATPMPVSGGGSAGGPNFLPTQGSGTGVAGQGVSGPGPVPFRTVNGKPPVR